MPRGELVTKVYDNATTEELSTQRYRKKQQGGYCEETYFEFTSKLTIKKTSKTRGDLVIKTLVYYRQEAYSEFIY